MKQDYHRSGKTIDRIARFAPCDEGATLQLLLETTSFDPTLAWRSAKRPCFAVTHITDSDDSLT